MRFLRNLCYGILLTAGLLLLALSAACLQKIAPNTVRRITRVLYRFAARMLRLHIIVRGDPPPPGALLIANHRSWIDIIVLGSACETGFVAKAEIRRWPLLGTTAAAIGTVFVDRGNPRQVHVQRDQLAAALQTGARTVLFAEGTTHDSRALLPFKSALLAAVPVGASVVPTALEYCHLYGIAGGRRLRAEASWIGEVDFMPHLRERLRGGPLRVEVRFCPPITAGDNRKALAFACRTAIQSALHAIHERSE